MYCSVDEIQAEFKNVEFSDTTNVKLSSIEQFIIEADALINSYVGMVYSIPVSGDASALALLKMLSRSLVADRVRGILEVKQATNKDGNQNPRAGMSTKEAMSILKDIKDGNLNLNLATPASSGGSFYSNNYSHDVTPVMEKDTKQW